MSNYDFQKVLRDSILNADEKLNKKELLEDVFKTYVAKLFEITIKKSGTKTRLPVNALIEVKKNLINEFRQAELNEYQKSVEQYENLFDKTVEEIVNFAGSRHGGIDDTTVDKTLSINKQGFWEKHQLTDSGLLVPK